jgi:hypothetical protein
MLTWLIDNSTLVYTILGAACLGLGLLWWRTKYARYLEGSALALALIAAVWTLGFFVDTDTRRIVRAVEEMRAGVQGRDVDRIFAQISRHFRFGGSNFTEFRRRVADVIRSRNVNDVNVWDFEPGEISRTRGTATINFKVKPTGDWGNDARFYRCDAEFVLDPDGQWRMRGFQVFNPFVDAHQPLPIPEL